MRSALFLALLLLILPAAHAATPVLAWDVKYDYAGGKDTPWDMVQDEEGATYILGEVSTPGARALLVKFDKFGTKIWHALLGNSTPTNNFNRPMQLEYDAVNKVVIAAIHHKSDPADTNSTNIGVFAHFKSGIQKWKHDYDHENSHSYDELGDIAVAPNGDVVVTGKAGFAFLVYRLSSAGALLWKHVTGGSSSSDAGYGRTVGILPSGKILAGGQYSFNGQANAFTIRLDASGGIESYGTDSGTADLPDEVVEIVVAPSGFYYILLDLVFKDGNVNKHVYWMERRGLAYQTVWARSYLHPQGDSFPTDLAVDAYENAYMTGFSYNGASYGYGWATQKVMKGGAIGWTHRRDIDGQGLSNYAWSVATGPDGTAYIAGDEYHSAAQNFNSQLLALDSVGTFQWIQSYNPANKEDRPFEVQVTEFGNVLVGGHATLTTQDFSLLRYVYPSTSLEDKYTTPEGKALLTSGATGVFANDSSTAGGEAVLSQAPVHGTVELYDNGSFNYVPDAGYNGIDTFYYKVHKEGLLGAETPVYIDIQPLVPALLTLAQSSLAGGSSTTATVTLNGFAPPGGVVVTVADNSSAVDTPPSATIPAGAKTTTFTVGTQPVSQSSIRTVTVSRAGASKTATLTINPAAVASLTLQPTTVTGGQSTTGTVTLDGKAATGGTVVTLTDDSSAITTPASVTVLAGASSAQFTATTSTVSQDSVRKITATTGAVSKSAFLTIKAGPPVLVSLGISPSSIKGGNSTTGTVSLSGAAPVGGASVAITDNSSAVTTPASVAIAQGATSAQFQIGTAAVTQTYVRTVTATYNGVSKTTSFTITP